MESAAAKVDGRGRVLCPPLWFREQGVGTNSGADIIGLRLMVVRLITACCVPDRSEKSRDRGSADLSLSLPVLYRYLVRGGVWSHMNPWVDITFLPVCKLPRRTHVPRALCLDLNGLVMRSEPRRSRFSTTEF